LAETAHWLLYGSLILVPLTGWIHHASAEGYAPIWWPFGQSLPFVPKSPELSHTFSVLHGILEKVLLFTLIAHVLGALKHHFIDRDATLLRMLPGYPATGPLEDKHSVFAPLFVALVSWAATLGTGAGLGLFAQPERTEAAALAEVETDWTVTEGDIAITVQQMGSSVTGSFADWTASISYDETAETDVKGQAEVTISIPSLTLGTVTDQAMGPDYFNVEEHPTATFTADLISTAEGHTVEGTLTIKGYEQPITMPFGLTIDGDTATVNGTVTLDRRNYHVGDSMTDEGSLGYSVDVAINLTATRAAEGE
jgi:polyisoprenoid-binding protein YceI